MIFFMRNVMFITFSQQTLGGKLLIINYYWCAKK